MPIDLSALMQSGLIWQLLIDWNKSLCQATDCQVSGSPERSQRVFYRVSRNASLVVVVRLELMAVLPNDILVSV